MYGYFFCVVLFAITKDWSLTLRSTGLGWISLIKVSSGIFDLRLRMMFKLSDSCFNDLLFIGCSGYVVTTVFLGIELRLKFCGFVSGELDRCTLIRSSSSVMLKYLIWSWI